MLLEKFIGDLSFLKLAVLAWLVWMIQSYIRYFIDVIKIRRLGGPTAKVKSYAPLGLDIMYQAINTGLKHEMLGWWEGMFAKFSDRANPYTVEIRFADFRSILTADPENIKAILATQFQDFGKGERFNQDFHAFLGDSIFTTDGELWHSSRQLIRPQFIKDRVSDLHIFEKHCQILLPLLGGQGQTVDVADLFFKFTLDAATEFLMGKSVNSLEHDSTGFAQAFNHVQHMQVQIGRAGPFRWAVPKKSFFDGIKTIDKFTEQYIDATLRLTPEELEKTSKTDEGYTFLHALASHTRDRTVLRDQVVAVLLAGRDTTACTLSWLFYELSLQPEIVKKLRAEILKTVGSHAEPTYDQLKSMKYLQHCLNETLRLYPIVPYNVRFALKDTTIPRGGGPDGMSPVGVLKGTPVSYASVLMQRRADLYPPESSGFPPVLKFVPERWDKWFPTPWTYIPFNGGPRLCVGQQFALTELAYTVTRIFQRYGTIENRMAGPPKLQADIVLQPHGGAQLAFYDAKA